jgi:ADP-ribosylglycohydrolase
MDTVPFALWCAAGHHDDLVEALWTTVLPGGDLDTTCAIVGGVVAARTGLHAVPADWLAACEPLPDWVHTLTTTRRPRTYQAPPTATTPGGPPGRLFRHALICR